MTKELLEQYPDICAEIEEIKADKTTDTVSGSANEFPYGKHTITIKGPTESKMKRLEELCILKGEIENFINTLPQSKQRRVVRHRAIKKLPWDYVSQRTGYTISQCKHIYSGVIKNFCTN